MTPNGSWAPRIGDARASLRRSAGLARRKLADLFHSPATRFPSRRDAFQHFLSAPTHSHSLLTIDHGLVAAGIGAAIGSAAFAAYMITRDNSHPVFGGAEHLMLFAQPLGAGSHQRRIDAVRPLERPFDFGATGSIRRGGLSGAAESRDDAAAASRDDEIQTDPRDVTLEGYVLRFARNGVAFVQSAQGSFVVARGAILPGAGRVHSIEKRGNRWVVVTARGLVSE